MSRHLYPNAAMTGDYLRAAAGFVPVMAILAVGSLGPTATAILGCLAALFAVFGLRTALRHLTRIETTESGVRASGPLAAAIPWTALDRMKLAYYSTRRDRRDGWMQLELRGGGATIRLDSRIEGFGEVVRRAAVAAAARDLPLGATTLANLESLGIGSPVLGEAAGMAGGRA